MKDGMTVQVEGLTDLQQTLLTFPKRTAKSTLRRVLMKAADPLVEVMRGLAPKAEGNLQESITKTSRKPHDQETGRKAFGRVLRGGGSREDAKAAAQAVDAEQQFAEVFVGPGRDPAAMQQEYGNSRHAAQPFVRPAFDGEALTALDVATESLRAEIEKTAKRLAKRQAKLIAETGGG